MTKSGEPTVSVIDDDTSVLDALSQLLSPEFDVRAYDSAAAFLAAIRPDTPGCIVLDLALPGMSGLEVQERLIEAGVFQPVIFLSGSGSVRTSVQAMQAGAMDFIEKPCDEHTLFAAIRRALERDRELRAKRDAIDSSRRRIATLTQRESEVFRHVIAGRLNKQIAAKLGTAEKTIKVHRARIMRKVAVRSVAELTRLAEHAGVRPAP